MRNVDFGEAERLLSEPNAVILDVREEFEYRTGHAAGARLLPVDTITAETAAALIAAKDAPVLVYCRTGSRSRVAAQRLTELGYARVYDVGSLVGWPFGISTLEE